MNDNEFVVQSLNSELAHITGMREETRYEVSIGLIGTCISTRVLRDWHIAEFNVCIKRISWYMHVAECHVTVNHSEFATSNDLLHHFSAQQVPLVPEGM